MNEIEMASVKNAEFMPDLVDGLIKEGDYAQAREIINGAIRSLSAEETEELLEYRNLLCKVERAAKNFQAALKIHTETYPLAHLSNSHARRARFHCGYATTCEEIGYFDRAFVEYEAARFHFEEAGELDGAGYVENNIAVLKLALGLAEEAREHVARARSYFTDPEKLAEIDVTDAQISLAKNQSEQALSSVLSACNLFKQTGNKKLFDESLPTLIKAAVDYQCSRQISAGSHN